MIALLVRAWSRVLNVCKVCDDFFWDLRMPWNQFSELLEFEQRQLCYLGWIQYIWRSGDSLSHCPCPPPTKSVMGFRIQKIKHIPATNHANMIFLLALNQAEICDTWSPECNATDRPFSGFAKSHINYISIFSELPWAHVFLSMQLEPPHRNQHHSTKKFLSSKDLGDKKITWHEKFPTASGELKEDRNVPSTGGMDILAEDSERQGW